MSAFAGNLLPLQMRALTKRWVDSWVAAVAIAVAGAGACVTEYQKGAGDPAFGAPNSLAGQRQPGPTSEVMRGGNEPSSSEAGAGAMPECVRAGGTLATQATCTVSFKTILAAFKAANCQTAGTCHGGASPPNQPRIDPDDADGMWKVFSDFKLSNGKLYINPCSTDPAQSSIGCNVNLSAPCGSVMPPGLGLAPNVLTDIDTWLKCGSPNN